VAADSKGNWLLIYVVHASGTGVLLLCCKQMSAVYEQQSERYPPRGEIDLTAPIFHAYALPSLHPFYPFKHVMLQHLLTCNERLLLPGGS
jgi:hypothetical protein